MATILSIILIPALSTTFLIISLYTFTKTNHSKLSKSLFFFISLCSVILLIAYSVSFYFTGNGIDEATIYHLKYGLRGAGFLEYGSLILSSLILFFLSVLLLLWVIFRNFNHKNNHLVISTVSYTLLLASLVINPTTIDIYNLNKVTYNQEKAEERDDFTKYYIKPDITKSGNKSKNIVFVYAESIERTYFNESIFPGLINGLREIEAIGTSFTNIQQATGTGWTVGGITSSLCGIPLFTPSHGNSMSGMDQFLPSAICLTDLLNKEGYHLTYMGGASLEFAGKGKLFKTHGFKEVLGREELLPKLEDDSYKSGWGLYDDSLLDMVFKRFMELSESNQKFGIFTLTLDTHHPHGHISRSCKDVKYNDDSNSILNAVACSDFLLTNFIQKIIQSPYAEETIIVLASDHLALRNTAYNILHKHKNDRRNLFIIIEPNTNRPTQIETLGSTLDIGTTLLPFIGYTGNIGLGRNLTRDENFLVDDIAFIQDSLTYWKRHIVDLWAFPKIEKKVEIDIDREIVVIDDREFRIPILIELDSELQTTLKFDFNKSEGHKTLSQHAENIDRGKSFILINRFKDFNFIDKVVGKVVGKAIANDSFKLIAGNSTEYTKIMELNENITYSYKDILQLLNLPSDY